MQLWELAIMGTNIKLIKPDNYLIELDLKNTLYLNEFFDESDFGKKDEKVDNESFKVTRIDDVDDEDEDYWIESSVESSEKSESSENSESLDFAAMNDDELIAYYNCHNLQEVIKLDGYAPYYLDNYIFDYYVGDSKLVVNGKLFYKLTVWSDEKNINTSMKALIVDFKIEFDTTNVSSGRIEILNTTVKANMNNHVSHNEPLTAIANDIVIIPFSSNSVLPKNVKLINSIKKEAFNFSDLQYTEYDWKLKRITFDW